MKEVVMVVDIEGGKEGREKERREEGAAGGGW